MRISGVTYASRKTHKTKYIVFTSIILILIIILTVAIISLYSGWDLLHPQKKSVETFSSNIVPEYREISFRGTDKNVVLSGWFFQTKSSDKTVIMVHSYGKNRLEFGNKSVDMIKEFLNNDYNVFTFDLRNSGKSGGKMTTFGYDEKDDIQGAIDYVKQQGSKHIILIGFSTGASAAIQAAEGKENVDAVIADSPYADLHGYLSNNLNKWTKLPAFPFNKTILASIEIITGIKTSDSKPVATLKNLPPCHLMLIYGKGDKIISPENSRKIYSTYSGINPELAEAWETDDTGDATSYLNDQKGYMEKVFAFLDKIYKQK